MSRLLALSLLALAAPGAAAEQVHSCQAETPPCSPAMAQARHYLDELDRNAGNFVAPPLPPPVASPEHIHPCRAETPPCSPAMARARHYLDELDRQAGNFVAPDHYEHLQINPERSFPAFQSRRPSSPAAAPPQPRYHVPYPLSRELLTGAVNPCSGSRPACPWELENIYDGLELWRDDENSRHYEYYLFRLEKYYRNYQP